MRDNLKPTQKYRALPYFSPKYLVLKNVCDIGNILNIQVNQDSRV